MYNRSFKSNEKRPCTETKGTVSHVLKVFSPKIAEMLEDHKATAGDVVKFIKEKIYAFAANYPYRQKAISKFNYCKTKDDLRNVINDIITHGASTFVDPKSYIKKV